MKKNARGLISHKITAIILSIIMIMNTVCLVLPVFAKEKKAKVAEGVNAVRLTEIRIEDDVLYLPELKEYGFSERVGYDYHFYRVQAPRVYYYIANLLVQVNGIINFTIESTPKADFLHIAFYDEKQDVYFYYSDVVNTEFSEKIKCSAKDIEMLNESVRSTVLSSATWYMRLNRQMALEIPSIQDTEESSKAKLQILQERNAEIEKLNQSYRSVEKRGITEAESFVDFKDLRESSITELIPRNCFKAVGKKTGSNGSLGYYINTVEQPKHSGRLLSEVLVWSTFISSPSYTSDELQAETKAEFLKRYEYAPSGNELYALPADMVLERDDLSFLTIKNVRTKFTIMPTGSVIENGTVVDKDEYFYSALGEMNGRSGSVGDGFEAPFSLLNALAADVSKQNGNLTNGDFTVAFSAVESLLSGYHETEQSNVVKEKHVYVNYTADRELHYVTYGNKFIRQIEIKTAPWWSLGPNNHVDFKDKNARMKFSGHLQTQGTDLSVSKQAEVSIDLDVFNTVLRFWGVNQADESYCASRQMIFVREYNRSK